MKIEHARLSLPSTNPAFPRMQVAVGANFNDPTSVTFSAGTVSLKEARELGRFLVGLPDDEPAPPEVPK